MATSVTVKNTSAHASTDPLRNFKFVVAITLPGPAGGGQAINLGFMSVSGLSITTEVIPYREGGMNTTTQKMPGQSDFAPITLSRGFAPGGTGAALANWMRQLFVVQSGTGGGLPYQEFRGTVDVKLLAHPVTTQNVPIMAWWRIYNAWPTALAFGDLDAGANAVSVEQISLAHEGWALKEAQGNNNGVTF